MYGKDYTYAQTRIVGTIVRVSLTGEPVYVTTIDNRGHCFCVPIDKKWNEMEHVVQIHLDDLDLHPVPLGYVNSAGNATYLMRIPMRKDWKQGLRQENCHSSGRRLYQIPMKDIKNCIMGIYPTFERALRDVKVGIARGRNKVIAWHRYWAVDSMDNILYKNQEKVGDLVEGKVVLLPSFRYLKEAFEESKV